MTRVQILLTEEQDLRLEKLARRLGTSKAKLVREGVEYVLQRKQGRKDISRSHDAYLAAAERRTSR